MCGGGVYVIDPLLFSDFNEMPNSSTGKFHENPSSGSRVVPFVPTDDRKDRQT